MKAADRGRWQRWLGLLALVAAGCSGNLLSSSSRDAEIAELKRQVLEQKKRATVSEVEAARLRREVARLEDELEEARNAAVAASAAPRPSPVPPSGSEPVIEDLPRIEVTDLEDEPVAPPPRPAPPAAPPVAPPVAAPDASSAESPPEAQILYDEGYTLFNQGRYAEAEARFRRYQEQYPASGLADNALFCIGESRYARGDFSSALDAFSKTVERYPDGNKIGDALLKAGKCLEALGEVGQARSTYEEVVRRYPGSAAAALARDRLAALQGG